MRKNFKTNRKKGFSFVEVMLVVFILATTLVVFIQVISKSIIYSTESRDTIIAAGLAQEGAELVKNIRDNNWAQKEEAFRSPFPSDGDCRIDYNTHGNSGCSSNSHYNLNFANDFYSHTNAPSATKFFRKIHITGDADTKIVTSYVIWGSTFPASITDCNVASKCIYTEIALTKWGE